MENRIQQLFLNTLATGALTLLGSTSVHAANDAVQVIRPDVQPRTVEEAEIDTELFELGVYGGVISIEDFGASPVAGAQLTFHATEDFFLKASYGIAEADESTVATVTGQPVLSSSERDYQYYDLSVGYNLFPGQVFVSDAWTFNSAYHVSVGFGSTEFGGDSNYTVTLATGYRAVLTDWLTFNADFKDHVFETDIFGPKKRTHNLEFSLGVSLIF